MSADAVLALMRAKWIPETKRGQYALGHASNMIAAHAITVLEDAGFTITGPSQDRGGDAKHGPYWTDDRIAELLAQSRLDREKYAAPVPDDEVDDEFAGITAPDAGGSGE